MDTPIAFYTDGSVMHKHGTAGFAAVPMTEAGLIDESRVITGSKISTDIEEVELLAVVSAIKACPKGSPVVVFTDHKAICDVLNKPVRSRCESGRNFRLWNQIRQLCRSRPVTLKWVKAHSGILGNEVANRFARLAAMELFAAQASAIH